MAAVGADSKAIERHTGYIVNENGDVVNARTKAVVAEANAGGETGGASESRTWLVANVGRSVASPQCRVTVCEKEEGASIVQFSPNRRK